MLSQVFLLRWFLRQSLSFETTCTAARNERPANEHRHRQPEAFPTGAWTVDPVHSSISFAITHNNVATYRSGFETYEATLTGGEEPKLEGTVDVQSIDIDEAQLKGHLMSPEFFDAERFPKLTFTSTRFDVADDGTVRLAGDLADPR